MTYALVFSKDRPAQLDLLLSSIAHNAPWIYEIDVVFLATTDRFTQGYSMCAGDHEGVRLHPQNELDLQTRALLALSVTRGHHTSTFFCDDDVFWRPVPISPDHYLLDQEMLCFSLRLGRNTTECYSMRRSQDVPSNVGWFAWRDQEDDFAYPGSLDGHIFSAERLVGFLHYAGRWNSPNDLEDALVRACRASSAEVMGCYTTSCVVGVPVNLVNGTHTTNRHAEKYPAPADEINERYLAGERIDMSTVIPEQVNAAHVEFPLVWRERSVAA